MAEVENEIRSSNSDVEGNHEVSSGDWWERVDKVLILGSYSFSIPSTVSEGLARQENIMGVVTVQQGADAEQQESPVAGFSLASVMKIMTLAAPQSWSQPLLPGPPINMEFCHLSTSNDEHYENVRRQFIKFMRKTISRGGCVYVQLTPDVKFATLIGIYLMGITKCSPQSAMKRLVKIQPDLKTHAAFLFSNLNVCLQELAYG